jgi:hypothetical protein
VLPTESDSALGLGVIAQAWPTRPESVELCPPISAALTPHESFSSTKCRVLLSENTKARSSLVSDTFPENYDKCSMEIRRGSLSHLNFQSAKFFEPWNQSGGGDGQQCKSILRCWGFRWWSPGSLLCFAFMFAAFVARCNHSTDFS